MTVRDVRLHWPQAEKALAQGEEIVVTRDAKPVARLLPFIPATSRTRPRFDPELHLRRLRRFCRRAGRVCPARGEARRGCRRRSSPKG